MALRVSVRPNSAVRIETVTPPAAALDAAKSPVQMAAISTTTTIVSGRIPRNICRRSLCMGLSRHGMEQPGICGFDTPTQRDGRRMT